MQESSYPSVDSKVERYYGNIPFEERPANSASAFCSHQKFPAFDKILIILLTTRVRSVFVNALFLL